MSVDIVVEQHIEQITHKMNRTQIRIRAEIKKKQTTEASSRKMHF